MRQVGVARPRLRVTGMAAVAAASMIAATTAVGSAQQRAVGGPEAKRFVLKVTTTPETPTTIDLEADHARVGDIAAELAMRLGIPITVGRELELETISLSLPESGLESALQSLAPRVMVDYEIRQGRLPTPEAVYLLGPTDEPPATGPTRGPAQGVLITGHTEDSTQDDEPLKVAGDRDRLSIVVRKQSLSVVAMAIGEVLGVPVEMAGQGTEVINAEVANLAADDAVTRISRNLAITVRADLVQLERRPLRLVVLPIEEPGGL